MPTVITGTDGVSQVQADAVESTDLPAGSVVQVVQGKASTTLSTTSTSFVDTNLSATITPNSSSNSILVIVNHGDIRKTTNNGINLQVVRNSTVIGTPIVYGLFTDTTLDLHGHVSISYLDQPATTSPVTYKTQLRNTPGTSGTIRVQTDNTDSTITLMEIAG